MFAPYRDVRKVSIFGSARTTPDSPIYTLTAATARALADHQFMVVTGAGPGIMEAGMVGAGKENSIGVSIDACQRVPRISLYARRLRNSG